MTDEELWSRYAAAALRNPPNEDVGMVPWATSWATKVADAMLAAHRERWPGSFLQDGKQDPQEHTLLHKDNITPEHFGVPSKWRQEAENFAEWYYHNTKLP